MFLGEPKLFKGITKNFEREVPSGHSPAARVAAAGYLSEAALPGG